MPNIQPEVFDGHTFFPGADNITPFRDGYFFYMVTVSYQNGPNDLGSYSTHGLLAPKDKAQYGQLVNSVLEFVRRNGPGRVGSKVVQFFDIKPHGEFRSVDAQAQERQRADAERDDDQPVRAELLP